MSVNTAEDDRVEKLIELLTTRRDKPIYLQISERQDGTLGFKQIEFITPEQLAELTHVETRTVYSWIEKATSGDESKKNSCPPIYNAPGTHGKLFDLHESIEWIKDGGKQNGRPEDN
jgi:hypothetical protein